VWCFKGDNQTAADKTRLCIKKDTMGQQTREGREGPRHRGRDKKKGKPVGKKGVDKFKETCISHYLKTLKNFGVRTEKGQKK